MEKCPNTEKSVALQMAVKSINNSVCPDGSVPTPSVYGAIPRLELPTEQPTPSAFKRALALRKELEPLSRHFASRKVCDAMACRNGANVTDIHHAPIGSKVLVYRAELDRIDGLFDILPIN